MTETGPRINFAEIRIPLDELGQAVVNRIDRDLRSCLHDLHACLPALLKLTVRVSRVTWRSVDHLFAGKPEDPSAGKDFALAIPPLARSILDSLFTIVFIFDDPAERTAAFLRSTWREAYEKHARLVRRYGCDEAWRSWLAEHEKAVQGFRGDAGVAADYSPENVKWWPNPGKMRDQTNDDVRREFLKYLYDWHYKKLSGEAHLSGIGFATRAGLLADRFAHTEERRDEVRVAHCHQSVLEALVLYVCLLTELACQLDMTHQKKHALRIWSPLRSLPAARELWGRRYRDLLDAPESVGAGVL